MFAGRMGRNIAVILAVALAGTGCWYSFTDKPYPDVRTVGVIPFDNKTTEYEIPTLATEYLTQKLASGSAYSLAEPQSADAVLSGEITAYKVEVNTYDEQENPIDYIVRVRATVIFKNRLTGKQIWSQVFEGHATFPADGDEENAKTEAVRMLVDRIYEKLKSG